MSSTTRLCFVVPLALLAACTSADLPAGTGAGAGGPMRDATTSRGEGDASNGEGGSDRGAGGSPGSSSGDNGGTGGGGGVGGGGVGVGGGGAGGDGKDPSALDAGILPAPGPVDAADGDLAGRDGPAVNDPRCKGSGLAVCESFEEAAVGTIPAGWGKRQGWGGKTLAVAAEEAARGTRALKIEGGATGSQFLEWKGPLGALASEHYGRIFFKVKTPAPWPSGGVLHGDIVQHLGPHPGGGENGVRWGIVANTQMKFQWIFNVQPSAGEGEFGDGTAYTYSWPGRWQCLEWHYAAPTQRGEVWLDGAALPITVGKSHAPEIPVFTSLGVGWANYQTAPGPGFVVYIDEVAFNGRRIGCSN